MNVQLKIAKYHKFASRPQISTNGQLGRQGSRRVLRTINKNDNKLKFGCALLPELVFEKTNIYYANF